MRKSKNENRKAGNPRGHSQKPRVGTLARRKAASGRYKGKRKAEIRKAKSETRK
jgi:hypothetical protein